MYNAMRVDENERSLFINIHHDALVGWRCRYAIECDVQLVIVAPWKSSAGGM